MPPSIGSSRGVPSRSIWCGIAGIAGYPGETTTPITDIVITRHSLVSIMTNSSAAKPPSRQRLVADAEVGGEIWPLARVDVGLDLWGGAGEQVHHAGTVAGHERVAVVDQADRDRALAVAAVRHVVVVTDGEDVADPQVVEA